MTTKSTLPKPDISHQFQTVAQRLNVWRSTRRRGQRIPEDIWIAAVTLARAHGLNARAAALKLKFMIQITPQMRILVAVEPVDFRKGIDGLAALCRQALSSDPLGGTLFVFCSRRRHAIKCLMYDGQGFWLSQKRLSQGRFTGWPKAEGSAAMGLDPHQLHLLLWNGDPRDAHAAALWRRVPLAGGS